MNLRPLRCQHSALPLSYTPTGRLSSQRPGGAQPASRRRRRGRGRHSPAASPPDPGPWPTSLPSRPAWSRRGRSSRRPDLLLGAARPSADRRLRRRPRRFRGPGRSHRAIGNRPDRAQGSVLLIRKRRDRPERRTGKEGRAGRSGASGQAARRSPVRLSGRPPKGAGAFWRSAASLVGHDETSSLPPRSLPCTKMHSVTAITNQEDRPKQSRTG